jgi:hypothetical protein
MLVDTHLLMSNILCKYLSNTINFKIDSVAFAYGNIKPDFTDKEIKCAHTLNESLYSVVKYSDRLMEDNISIKEFSMSLGVTCHFICDYFCLYHREDYYKKGIVGHLFYEAMLHLKLIALLLRGKLSINKYESHENNVEELILKLDKKYNLESKGVMRDIKFSLIAATQISKLIIYSSKLYLQQNKTKITKENILPI